MTRTSTLSITLLLLAATVLGGCLADEEPADDGAAVPEPTPEAVDRPTLHGWIVDTAIRPLAGVTVEVIEYNETVVTNEDGFYGFDGLPADEALILVAAAEGFMPRSQQVTLRPDAPVRLNFTLQALPTKTPYFDVQDFNGLLGCQATVVVSEQASTADCSNGDPGDIWEFSVSQDLAGLVLEVVWEQATELSSSLNARLETLGLGDQNVLLAEAVGESILRLQVPQDVAERLYPAGGQMRLTVTVMPNTDEEESGLGFGVAVNQEFQAFASAFYVEAPPGTYTVAG